MESYIITILLIFNTIFYTFSFEESECNTANPQNKTNRINAVPVLYVEGNHFEVGFMIGKTFRSIIQDFVETYEPLEKYLEIYNTESGRTIYNNSLGATRDYFPQYVVELKGLALGANVPFHILYLIHMDDVILSSFENLDEKNEFTSNCTLIVNSSGRQYIGYNTDTLKKPKNRFYIINAQIKPTHEEGGGLFPIRKERWEAMTSAATLSGYTSGHNDHARAFLMRALLATKADDSEIRKVLFNEGVGTADAFHVNVGLLKDTVNTQKFYSIEVTPYAREEVSYVIDFSVQPDSTLFYTNRLQRTFNCQESHNVSVWNSSIIKENRYKELTSKRQVESLDSILNVFGDTEKEEWQMYRNRKDDFVETINTGVFDFVNNEWILWTNNPKINSPIFKLPLMFPNLIIDTEEELTNNTDDELTINTDEELSIYTEEETTSYED